MDNRSKPVSRGLSIKVSRGELPGKTLRPLGHELRDDSGEKGLSDSWCQEIRKEKEEAKGV